MIVEKYEYVDCRCCGSRKRVGETTYACDVCKDETVINTDKILQLTAFQGNGNNKDYHFCCWKHLFQMLPEIKCDHFVNLPTLSYDHPDEKVNAKGFLRYIEGLKNGK